MTGSLDGVVTVITGTGGGQGRAAAQLFAAEGALVVGCDVKEDGNAETVELVRSAGATMTGFAPVDLGDPGTAREFVEQAAAVHGRVDVLYNNASAARFGTMDPDGLSIEEWDFTVRNELDIIFYVVKPAWPHLVASRGVIINTASVAGWVGSGLDGVAHCATKGGVLAITRALASAGAPHGIRVNSISPGPIATPGTQAMFDEPGVLDAMTQHLLIPRAGTADEIAQAALYLAGPASSYVTGADLRVDGGMTAI